MYIGWTSLGLPVPGLLIMGMEGGGGWEPRVKVTEDKPLKLTFSLLFPRHLRQVRPTGELQV